MKAVCFVVAIAGLMFGSPAVLADPIIDADFEAFPTGSPPPTGTGQTDRPYSIDANLDSSVENSGTISGATLTTGNFVRLEENPGEAPDMRFDSGASLSSGIVVYSIDVLFENFEDYHIYFRNGLGSGLPPASQSVANIRTSGTNMRFESSGGTTAVSYTTNTTLRLTGAFDLDNDTWDAYINGSQVVSGQGINSGYVLGAMSVGFEFTSWNSGPGFGGVMQFDNAYLAPIPEPGSLALLGLGGLGLFWYRRRRKSA